MQIATSKGKERVDEIVLDGMKTAPIVITPVPNNGGGVSYSITHKPSGFAIIPGRTDDLGLVERFTRALWKRLNGPCREALKSPNFNPQHPRFNDVGCAVLVIQNQLEEAIAKAIKAEVARERRERNDS